MKLSISLLCCLLYLNVVAQEPPDNEYDESPDDPYIHVPRQQYNTSPAYSFTNALITTTQVNVNENGENMLGDAANEPSIAIDPINPERMAMGWRQFDTISSNFRQAGFGYSLDGGIYNWTFPGPIEPGVFRSDPVLDFDVNGTFYYNSLTSGYYCAIFKSDSDLTWADGLVAHGGDKQWMVIDRTNGAGQGNIYAFWKPNLSTCNGAFTRSVDEGENFEECSDMPNPGTRGTLAIGPSGELYAVGEEDGNFYVARSSNALDSSEQVIWDFSTTVDLGGYLSLYNGPNPNGMLGQVWVAVNHAEGPYYGHVYLLATVGNPQTGDWADIQFSKSEDGGETWSYPIKINDDESFDHYQWFGTISVAPNGRIDVAWVDTRDYPGTYLSSLYYSFSEDGGETWLVNENLSEPFDPHLGWPSQNKLGDYYHSISDDDGMHLAWAATFNGEQDVYYSYIENSPINSTNNFNPASKIINIEKVFPNPFSDFCEIKYSLKKRANVQIEILDILGNRVELIESGVKMAGDYNSTFYPKNESLTNGLFFYKIKVDGNPPISDRMVFLK